MRLNITLNIAIFAVLAAACAARATVPATALQALESFLEDAQVALDSGDEQHARELVRIASRCNAPKTESVEPSESGDQPLTVFRSALVLAVNSVENKRPEQAMRVLQQLVGCTPKNEVPAYILLKNGSVAPMPDLFGNPDIQATINMKELSWTGRLPRKSLREAARETSEISPASRLEREAIAALLQRLCQENYDLDIEDVENVREMLYSCLGGAKSEDNEEQ